MGLSTFVNGFESHPSSPDELRKLGMNLDWRWVIDFQCETALTVITTDANVLIQNADVI